MSHGAMKKDLNSIVQENMSQFGGFLMRKSLCTYFLRKDFLKGARRYKKGVPSRQHFPQCSGEGNLMWHTKKHVYLNKHAFIFITPPHSSQHCLGVTGFIHSIHLVPPVCHQQPRPHGHSLPPTPSVFSQSISPPHPLLITGTLA